MQLMPGLLLLQLNVPAAATAAADTADAEDAAHQLLHLKLSPTAAHSSSSTGATSDTCCCRKAG
jgi:hypothetical protein